MTTFNNDILIVIPTRNRAELAKNAILSALGEGDTSKKLGIKVLVSDNSTNATESASLQTFCDRLRVEVGERLRYVRPPEPLSVSYHFDWAFQFALDSSDAGYFTCLTDRMLVKTGGLRALRRMVSKYPNQVTCFLWDTLMDHLTPIQMLQHQWTGLVIQVPSAKLLRLASRMEEYFAPKMTNCVMPRLVLEAVRGQFGNLCISITPDICFGYRCLSLVDSVLHYDKALYLQYGLAKSGHVNLSQGTVSPGLAEFMKDLGEIQLNYATPIPGVYTPSNTIVHEYCLAKQKSDSSKFPDLDMKRYIKVLHQELQQIQDVPQRQKMEALLPPVEHEPESEYRIASSTPDPPRWKKLFLLHYLTRSVSRRLRKTVAEVATPVFFDLWMLLERFLGVRPPDENKFVFRTREQAMAYTKKFPRRKQPTAEHLATLLRKL